MERTPVSSSTIASIGYDHESETLEIEFHGGGIYQYPGVPEKVHQELMIAGSKGTYFDRNIKKAGYSYEKVA